MKSDCNKRKGSPKQPENTYDKMACSRIWLLLLTVATPITAIRLPACRDDGTLEVSTTSSRNVITCDDFNATDDVIVWALETPTQNISLAECTPSGSCSNLTTNHPFLAFSRGAASVTSNMTLSDVTAPVEGGVIVTCSVKNAPEKTARCKVDVVHPAEVTSCNSQAAHASWTADIVCGVTKVNSSLGRYQCHWYRGTSKDSQTTFLKVTTFTPWPHSDPSFVQGSCNLTSDLVAKGGSYYYRAVVYPGATEKVAGPVILVEPERPSITCQPQPWTEDSRQLTCSCSTQYPGQPVGRLQFFRGGVGVVTSGGYGDLRLEMPPQNLTGSDLGTNRAFFSCLVQWVGNNPRDLHKVALEDPSGVPLALALTVGILGGLLLLALVALLVCGCCWYRRHRHERELDRIQNFDKRRYQAQ